jgi:hypothetical protein
MRELAASLFAIAVLLTGGGAASPLRYLAPFNPDWQLSVELGHPLPTFQNLNFGCNASILAAGFAKTKVPGFISLENCFVPDGGIWDYASARRGLNGTGLMKGWKEALGDALAPALPLFERGALVGVFLGVRRGCT